MRAELICALKRLTQLKVFPSIQIKFKKNTIRRYILVIDALTVTKIV